MNHAATNDEIVVEPATAADSADALRMLLGRSPQASIDDILPEACLPGIADLESKAVPGLFCATNANDPQKIIGVIWARHAMPGVHSIWQAFCRPKSPVVESKLYEAIDNYLGSTPFRLARALADIESPFQSRLAQIGFSHQTDIVSRLWQPDAITTGWMPDGYSIHTLRPGQDDEFTQLMERTYQQSLDCPDLVKLLTAKDLLKFYRASTFATQSSFFLLYAESEPAGCLVLTDDMDNESLELTYMGVAPNHRGNGLGQLLVNFAKERAYNGLARRLVVAVDRTNEPAWKIYEDAEFATYSTQALMVRTGPSA